MQKVPMLEWPAHARHGQRHKNGRDVAARSVPLELVAWAFVRRSTHSDAWVTLMCHHSCIACMKLMLGLRLGAMQLWCGTPRGPGMQTQTDGCMQALMCITGDADQASMAPTRRYPTSACPSTQAAGTRLDGHGLVPGAVDMHDGAVAAAHALDHAGAHALVAHQHAHAQHHALAGAGQHRVPRVHLHPPPAQAFVTRSRACNTGNGCDETWRCAWQGEGCGRAP